MLIRFQKKHADYLILHSSVVIKPSNEKNIQDLGQKLFNKIRIHFLFLTIMRIYIYIYIHRSFLRFCTFFLIYDDDKIFASVVVFFFHSNNSLLIPNATLY